ncbi:uncharacterized protein RJT20DRAFT_154457 [Scheffersomyces xylosifermentans]|uniref:uncharacterized protein n=1 Tax=Scheffersomyces xylosifermentans TaxID=1304137 RepID=UPI00315D14D8
MSSDVATVLPSSKLKIAEKPARLQVDPDTIPDDDKPPQSGNIFNIWYLKWSGGGDSSSKRNYTKSKFRVNVDKDSGYTRARNGSSICLFFARGCCYLGKKCPYYHRIPIETDYFIPTQDCFGRDRTSEYRDDMDGVGSFNRTNRSLYVGGINMADNMENTITKHFQEFGDIEKIRVLHSKSCAFITFRLEASAQFAKEAMQNQSLEGNEVLNIRWANEDPNPQAQRQEKRRLEEIALNTVKNLLQQVDHKERPSKKAKVIVEEPQEDRLVQPTVQKQIEHAPQPVFDESSTGILFNKSSLETLAKVRAKKAQLVKEKPTQSINTLLSGYSTDEEDDE